MARPVLGSPTAATSEVARKPHDVEPCQLGLAIDCEHELPPERHALSVQPREFDACDRVVPPTPTTCADVLG